MNTPRDEIAGWSPQDELSHLARAWDVPLDAIHRRLDEVRATLVPGAPGEHVSLERLANSTLTPADKSHIKTCAYCQRLKESVTPAASRIEEVTARARNVEAQRVGSRWTDLFDHLVPIAGAATAAIAAIAISVPVTMHFMAQKSNVQLSAISSAYYPLSPLKELSLAYSVDGTAKCTAIPPAGNDASRKEYETAADLTLTKVFASANVDERKELFWVAAEQFCAAGQPAKAAQIASVISILEDDPKKASDILYATNKAYSVWLE